VIVVIVIVVFLVLAAVLVAISLVAIDALGGAGGVLVIVDGSAEQEAIAERATDGVALVPETLVDLDVTAGDGDKDKGSKQATSMHGNPPR
jgi:hypothetical protein